MGQGEQHIAGDAARAVAGAAKSGRSGAAWGRRAGFAGAALGAVAAGVAVERLTVHRGVRRNARAALDAAGPYGSLRGTAATVPAEDGTELYYETEEPVDPSGGEPLPEEVRAAAAAASGDGVGGPTVEPVHIGRGRPAPAGGSAPEPGPGPVRAMVPGLLRLLRLRRGSASEGGGDGAGAPLPTVVFTHGYCLTQDSWHFQRAAFRGGLRTVYWDQRSHGRSARAPAGRPVSVDDLGRDLKRVLDAAVPEGPVVLVGHSMGGMTMMALADQYPDYVAERVVGVAFVDTSAGGLAETTYGLPLPAAGVRAVRRAVPGVLKALVAQTELVERGRRAAGDLFAGLIKRYSFGSVREVDPGVARFAERMIESVPIDVVAEFYPAFEAHEKTAALAAFDGRPALVLAGDRDLQTPHAHSEAIAAALPGSRLVTLERTGHLSMLERPHEVNDALARLITRTVNGADGGASDGEPDAGEDGPDDRG